MDLDSNRRPYSSAYENRGFTRDTPEPTNYEHRDPQFINRLSRANFGKYGIDISPLNLHSAQPAVYELDHLVTFDVGTRGGVTSAADGIRKLRQMEATSGIWTRRVLFSIDQREVVVSEKAGGVELECFPISQIVDPISYTESTIPNVFNNLVMFVVRRESWTGQPSIMNIFQCIAGESQEVVEDIKAACSGKFPRSKTETSVDTRTSSIKMEDDSPRSSANDDTKTNGGDHLTGLAVSNRVALLNCCFDDIEDFVSRIQKSAKDFKDSKENDYSRVPSKREFVDILQKFKLTLNLTAELRKLLQNPSSAELVRSLFSPLELVVNVCRDHNGEPRFVENVLSPLLTAEACRFLEANLSENELRLWRSLGRTWTTSRETWSGPAPSNYFPKFRTSSNSGRSEDSGASSSKISQENSLSIINENEPNVKRTETKELSPEQQSYLQQLQATNSKVCVVTFSREEKNHHEITVVAGEYVEVLEHAKNWWKVRNSKGLDGFAPKTILKKHSGF